MTHEIMYDLMRQAGFTRKTPELYFIWPDFLEWHKEAHGTDIMEIVDVDTRRRIMVYMGWEQEPEA